MAFQAPDEELEKTGFTAPKEDVQAHLQSEPSFNPVEHAAQNWNDPAEKDNAFEVYKQQQRQPVTAGDVGRGALQFAKGAIPTYDQNGNWSWPLASGVVQLGKGIVSTAKNIAEASQPKSAAATILGPMAAAAQNAYTEDPQANRAGRQLGVGVEEGALDAARMSAHARQNISGALGHISDKLGTQAKDLSDADLRKRFDDEVEAHHLQQQFQQGRYASLLPSGGGEAEGGEPIGMSPEQLAAQGAPINPEEIQGIASTTNPANFAELGAITNPIAKGVMAPIVKGTGNFITGAANLIDKTHAGPIGAFGTAAYHLFHGNPLGVIEAAGVPIASKVATNTARGVGNILTESGAEMAGAAPQVGQSALRKITKEGIKGAAGAVPTGAAFATTGTTPEEAGNQFWGAVGLGGALSGLSAVPKSGKSGAIENAAKTARLSNEGEAANFGLGYDALHQEGMQPLQKQTAYGLNAVRGFVSKLRTADGFPFQIYAVRGDKFADIQKQLGQIDANGNPTNPDGRGLTTDKGQLFINVDATGDINAPLGHETGHAVELATQYADSLLHESLKAKLTDGLYARDAQGQATPTPDFQRFIDSYSNAVGPDKSATMGRGDFESEFVAETARNLLNEGGVGKFTLPKSMAESVSNWLTDNLGIKPKAGKLGFDGTEVQSITRAVSDMLRASGTAPAQDTSAQYRIEQLKNTLKEPLARNATVADLNARDAARKELDTLQKQMNPAGSFPAAGKAPVPPSSPRTPPAPATDVPRVAATLRHQFGIPATEAAQWAKSAQGNTIEERVADALRQRTAAKNPQPDTQPQPVNARPVPASPPNEPIPTGSGGVQPGVDSNTATAEPLQVPAKNVGGTTTPETPVVHTKENLDQIAAQARQDFLADKKPALAGKNKGQHTSKNQQAADKAAFDAVAAAHAETVPANFDGMRQRVDAFGKKTVSGKLDPSRPFDSWLVDQAMKSGNLNEGALKTLLQFQDAIGKTVTYDYGHAPTAEEGEQPTGESRSEQQAKHSVAQRLAGESPKQVQPKTSIPLSIAFNSGNKSFTVYGASPEKLLNNFNHINEALQHIGETSPYRDINDPRLVADIKAVIRNHENGWQGDGTRPAVGTAEYPNTANPDWATSPERTELPPNRFEFVNMMLGDEGAKAGTPQAKAKAHLANENRRLVNEAGETNELRQRINESIQWKDSGGEEASWSSVNLEDTLNENISPSLAENIREPSQSDESIRQHGKIGDLNRFFDKGQTPNRAKTAAGFMPSEDTGKPEEGSNPGERLAREAEQSGIFLTMATMKGLMKQDAPTMDVIRKRIQDKTGKPARFQPAGKSGYTAPPKVQVFNGGGQGAVIQPERKKTPQERARERLALKAA